MRQRLPGLSLIPKTWIRSYLIAFDTKHNIQHETHNKNAKFVSCSMFYVSSSIERSEIRASGREAFQLHRSRRGTDCGAIGRENVGLSNRIARESRAHRKSKVSLAMVFNQGLGGPKTKPKGVADGQSVNILTPLYLFNKVRSLVDEASYWILVRGLTQERQRRSRLRRISLSKLPRKALFK